MSSLMHWFSAIAGSIREKTKMDITRPPINGYLFFVFQLRRTCTNYWLKKVLPAYCHFKASEIAASVHWVPYYVCNTYSIWICLWAVVRVRKILRSDPPPLPPPPLVIAPLSFLFCPGSTSLPGSFRPIPCSQRKSENLCDIVKKICEKVIGKWFWRRIEFSVKRYVRCLCRPRSVLFVLISTKVCEN